MLHNAEAWAVLAALAIVAIERYTSLFERLGLKSKSPTDAAAELAIAEHTIDRLREERNKARDAARELAAKTNLEPVLEQLGENARLQAAVLERLAQHNGSFEHMRESLESIGGSLGAIDLSLHELAAAVSAGKGDT